MTLRHYKYGILGGGVAAGYAACEFVKQGGKAGDLIIVSSEKVVAYERPVLSKAYLAPESPARIPKIHTCVESGDEPQTAEWYEQHGIKFLTGVTVTNLDVAERKMTLDDETSITCDHLVLATGSKHISFKGKVLGADLEGVRSHRSIDEASDCYDAIKAIKKKGGKAVLIGGAYLAMELAACFALNGLDTTIVSPHERLMNRLFTPELAAFYEKHYEDHGVKILKNTKCVAFEGANGKVTHAVVETDGEQSKLEADLVVECIGTNPNNALFEGQLDMQDGAVKVDAQLRTSVPGVYAVGDIAYFPIQRYDGDMQRHDHVIHARMSGKHVVKVMLGSEEAYDYVPSFYSKEFSLWWVFYGISEGEAVHWGDFNQEKPKFGAYWVKDGKVVGAFMEGGETDEKTMMDKVARAMPTVTGSLEDLKKQGLEFATTV